ncbi:MAG: peptidoglycan DD-metalloendopeptidase family protein [Anaeroplasma sp.]
MKDKIKGFFIEKKELLIFIGVVALVFIAVITVASIAINSNVPVSNNPVDTSDESSEPSNTNVVTPDPTTPPVALKFLLPISGEYEIVRTYFDSSLSSEELVSAIIDTGSKIITSTGISYAKKDNSVFSVLAIYDGEVVSIEEDELSGAKITIKHSDDIISIYSSLSDVKVSVGDSISQGTTLGNASASIDDAAAGVHVYLQIKVNNSYVNPNTIIGKEIDEVSATK